MSDGAAQRVDRTLAGVLLMVAAVTCFTGLDATAKWTSQSVPPIAVVAARYLSAIVFISALCRPWRNPGLMRTRSLRLQVVRALSLVLSTVCSFTSLHYLPLGQTTAITFAAPLVVAALAGPLLEEWPGAHRIGAIIAGFVGVLVVVRPGGSMHPAVFIALLTALSNAGYAILTRRLAGRDRSQTTLFYSGLIGAAVVAPVLPFVWAMPAGQERVIGTAVVGMGVLATLGHYLMILAYERAQASMLAPFSYAQLAGAVVIGWAAFGDAPDRWTLVGGAIVGGSGLYMLWRERSSARPR